MKRSLLRFFGTYLLFIILFVIQKIVFMLFYNKLYADVPFGEYSNVLWHGLVLDLSTAGYLTVIPGLLLIASLWIIPRVINPIFKIYYAIVSFLLSVIFVTDLILYDYWGFRLDSTPVFYFFSSPKDTFASGTTLQIIAAVIIISVLTFLLYMLFTKLLVQNIKSYRVNKSRGKISLILSFFTILLFVPIRGGFTVSTMNIGKAYYSQDMSLNHATINPVFTLLESLTREKDFGSQYRFMSPQEADKVFRRLVDKPIPNDSLSTDSLSTNGIPVLFKTERPNIIFVVLESFMSGVMGSLNGIPNVAVNMDKYAENGILFTNFYANSFRTDRGLVSIFSAYPGQPTTSIMKYPKKSQSLPSILLSLKKAGYNVDYYYGGDADFTNMRSYLLSMGINNIISDTDFPLTERLSKWGAHDHIVFNRLADDLKTTRQTPFIKIIQTSSSHEPFTVPFERLKDPFLNSIAYADSCLGDFVGKFRQTQWWDNSIIVLVPDHARRYPENISDLTLERFRIPLIFMGGALANDSIKIDTYASQIDIAATLLSQLNLPHEEFTFSKNILNPVSPHFGYFTFPNAFGMVTGENQLIYDCDADMILANDGPDPGKNLIPGKAFLQKLYDDLASR